MKIRVRKVVGNLDPIINKLANPQLNPSQKAQILFQQNVKKFLVGPIECDLEFVADKPPMDGSVKQEIAAFLKHFEGRPAAPVFKKICEIIFNPELFMGYLKELDTVLATKMSEQGIKISDDIIPQHFLFIEEYLNIIPPPPTNTSPVKKRKTLGKVLANREGKDEQYPSFFGYVDPEYAEKFVADGQYFSDKFGNDVRDLHLFLMHGKHTHRLFLEVVRQVIKELSKPESPITIEEVLQNLAEKVESEQGVKTAWDILLDTASFFYKLNEDKVFMPLSNPFYLHSMIMVFGENFGIKNLQKYELDIFYKELEKAFIDYKKSSDIEKNLGREILFEEFYYNFMLFGDRLDVFQDFIRGDKPSKYQVFGEGKYGENVVVTKLANDIDRAQRSAGDADDGTPPPKRQKTEDSLGAAKAAGADSAPNTLQAVGADSAQDPSQAVVADFHSPLAAKPLEASAALS